MAMPFDKPETKTVFIIYDPFLITHELAKNMIIAPEPYHLRPLELTDIDELMVIENLVMPNPASAEMYRRELTENSISTYYALTTADETNGRQHLIGYAGHWLIAEECHISIIAVHPSRRRHGLGGLLLLNQLLIACQQDALFATLEVRVGNIAAQTLYQRFNFDVVGRRRHYYPDGEDALLMTVEMRGTSYCANTLERKRQTLLARLQKSAL